MNHWRHLFRNLTLKELDAVLFGLGLAAASLLFLTGYDYIALRKPAPADGGSYTEGIVGEPRYLNPIVASANEVDRDITTLIFSGLVKHDEQGQIVPDLAESYEIADDGKTYVFNLRENLKWPDKTPFTADDVVFTINLIKDPRYQSPLRNNWQGVRVEKSGDLQVAIRLPVEYEPFLENVTVGILPQHLWESVQPQNFLLTQLNTKPVGLGQYQIRKISKNASGNIKSIVLSPNSYYPEKAHISSLTLRFYEDQNGLLNAFRRREVEGLSLTSALEKEMIKSRNANIHRLKLPRYFGVFFNQTKSDALKELDVRKALAYGSDREGIVGDILKGEGQAQYGPFPAGLLEIGLPKEKYGFDFQKAEDVLDKAGWKLGEDRVRTKKIKNKTVRLEFSLTTTDWPELTQVAAWLKRDWEKIGARVNLDVVPVNAVQIQNIRPREYEALLFGEVLGLNPDPFSFWHSTQKRDPGLNLALYSDKRVDGLLESARQTIEPASKINKYEEFQNIIARDMPAVFLYNPNYIYAVSAKINGVDTEAINTPAQRFENINKWYINTSRVRK